MDCEFCSREIVAKQKIAETYNEYVLYNIRAANRGQCLVVPKRHVGTIRELSIAETASLIGTVKKASEVLQKLHPDGFNYGFNEGKIAGQSIKHLHFHILPRFKEDSVKEHHVFHRNPDNKKNLSRKELESAVEEFRNLFINTSDAGD